MCGGKIQTSDGATHGICDSCGNTSTLPKASDDKTANLFNRANHFRRSNDFDRALTAYENILNEDNTCAEAHWCVVLCRYGIEYVEDPQTQERVPTCHRTQYDSILVDPDYKAAMEYAPDEYTRSLYEGEARKIAEIQKGILAVSSREEPYDVFICYKETTDGGSRTKESVIAQDIYHHLTDDGYRVFFSRITLEGKLGQQYEPIIFSALNSAKVMLVVGTRKEHLEAVWVKNEWSRYLALMKKDHSKQLIPCYRDMDPYDLPDELSGLQSQDMGNVGFLQDILRGVQKVLEGSQAVGKVAGVTGVAPAAPGVESLMKRGWLFLEDQDWKQADEYFDKVLDIAPEYALAYVGKLCTELKVQREEELINNNTILNTNKLYQKAIRFADTGLKTKLEKYNETINECIKQEQERQRKERYDQLVDRKNQAATESEFEILAREFKDMHGYDDSESHAQECKQTYQDIKAFHEERERQRISELETIRKRLFERFSKYRGCISTSGAHTVGLKTDGTVAAVGWNECYGPNKDSGQCNTKDWRNIVAVHAQGNHTIGLKANGTVIAIGENEGGSCNTVEWRDIVAIAAEDRYTVGLKSNGTIIIASTDLVFYTNALRNIISVSAGGWHIVGLKADGTVVAIGDNENKEKNGNKYSNEYGQCNVTEWRDIVTVFAGTCCTVGLKKDGTVVAVGKMDDRDIDTSAWRDVIAIFVSQHVVALKADGTVVVAGENEHGQCNTGDWRDIVAIAAGTRHTVGLKSDGTVVAVGWNEYGQCNTSEWRSIVAIDVCSCNTIGLKSDGTVVAVGPNDDVHRIGYGQCNTHDWCNIGPVSKEHRSNLAQQEQRDKEIMQQRNWAAAGLCRHCGGKMEGLIFKKCKSCGK